VRSDDDPLPRDRVLSVDALRGFDMLWIVGGDYVIRSLQNVHDTPATRAFALQMEHCDWAGFRFYDLIFPLFVWIVGVAIPFSLPRLISGGGRAAAVRRVAMRSAALFVLGVLYMRVIYGDLYLAGVLQRIAVAYFFAAMLFCFFRPATLAVWAAGLLVGYWALMTFVPVPGVGAATYEQGKNLAFYIDQRWLPGRTFEGTILSTLPAVSNCLLGVFAGMLLMDARRPNARKALILLAVGALTLAAGLLWSRQFPIIKLLWTSSYVLVSCGIAAMLLGVFHLVLDVWRVRAWSVPLVWIGMNAITIYLVTGVVNFHRLAERLVGKGDVAAALGRWKELVVSVMGLAMAIVLVRFLYRRRIFLRL
jgi:predicted acyltransferase